MRTNKTETSVDNNTNLCKNLRNDLWLKRLKITSFLCFSTSAVLHTFVTFFVISSRPLLLVDHFIFSHNLYV